MCKAGPGWAKPITGWEGSVGGRGGEADLDGVYGGGRFRFR